VFEDENRNWEAELQQRVGELVANRLSPLNSELEQLQAALSAASARLQEQTQAVLTSTESANLVAPVNELVETLSRQAEAEFQNRLQEELSSARSQIESEVRQQLEGEFQSKLEEQTQAATQAAEAELLSLRSQLAAVSTSQSLAVPASPSISAQYMLLKTAIEEIDAQRTQSETLTTLIKNTAQFAPRIAFFVVKSGDAVGWKTAGFDNGLSDENARSLSVSIQSQSLIGQALSSHRTAIALNPSQADVSLMLGRFSHPVPQGAVAVPLVVRGKAAAVLYADSGTLSDEAIQLEALESLIQVASMAIELLPSRRNAGDLGRAQTHAPAAQTTPPPQAVPAPVAAPVSPEPVAAPVAMEPANPAEVAEQAAEPADNFAPITQKPATSYEDQTENQRSAHSHETAEPVAESPAFSEPVPAQAEESYDTAASFSPHAAFQAEAEASPEPVPSTETEFLARANTHEAQVEKPFIDEKPSIYDLLRTGPVEPPQHLPSPGLSLPNYSSPDTSAYGKLGGSPGEFASKPGLSLPGWMQRLQEDNDPDEASSPFATSTNPDAATWPTAEEGIPPVPKFAPPPPPPPPVKPSSLPENLGLAPGEAETDRLPSPPTPQAFQVEAPSVRFSFNQPSEPPRYAAPSLSVSNAATETEVRAHNDARRFARLLVSEIKLYNAAKVNEGRRLSDLYDRLKDEVDRSRKVYDKRVSPAVAAKFDYFYDELVQTLAEGDPSKLGENCPGPVVLTT